MTRIVAFVLAGGEGQRLRPYTETCPKPALPFGPRYRIIDFVLGNLYNSGIRSIYVLAQYHARAILTHLSSAWVLPENSSGDFVQAVVPTRGADGRYEFKGTADAVWQNLHLLDRLQPDAVAVFAADHVYRMDVRQMIAFHDACRADATVAAVAVPLAAASAYGVIAATPAGRIRRFVEKPSEPPTMAGNPGCAFASMGNYVFRTEVLHEALDRAAVDGHHDFGHDVLPRLVHGHRVYAYDFGANRIPGLRLHEEHGYWRDVGTVSAYKAARQDAEGPTPRFALDNPQWPVFPAGAERHGADVSTGANNDVFGTQEEVAATLL